MKTYDEMKNNVFRRMDEYETEKKNRRKLYKRAALALCPLCAAGAAVFALWGGGVLGKNPETLKNTSTNAIAVGEKYAVTYGEDSPEKKMTMETHVAVSNADRPGDKSSEAADGVSDPEVQPGTEEKKQSGADVPEEKNGAEEKTTAAKVTTETTVSTAKTTTTAAETPTDPHANLWCIFVSSITYNGVSYHDSTVNISSFTQDRYIGRVSDFAGNYGNTVNYRINPDDSVYTVKETPDLLLVVKADSSSVYGSIIPMCSSSFSGDSYGYGSLVPNLTFPDSDGQPAVFN